MGKSSLRYFSWEFADPVYMCCVNLEKTTVSHLPLYQLGSWRASWEPVPNLETSSLHYDSKRTSPWPKKIGSRAEPTLSRSRTKNRLHPGLGAGLINQAITTSSTNMLDQSCLDANVRLVKDTM